MIDLHAHTTASDGQHSPEELIERARQAGVQTLAVTDHDTVAGIERARAAAARVGIELIPGIELSTFVDGQEAHILGHFIDPTDSQLSGFSEFLRGEREKRMVKMIARLEQLGFPVTFAEVVAASSGKNLGRPHLARVMIDRGYVKDVKEAFDRFIAVGQPAHIERYKLTATEAIRLIRRAGGAATLAHARVSHLNRSQVARLKQEGLAGLEVGHSDHPQAAREQLGAWAQELDLVPTAGSDFHGELVVPGRRLGTTKMDRADLDRLKARATSADA